MTAGIAIIYQEPVQFPDLTVAENIFVGRQPLRAGRRIDRRAMNREAAQIFERLGVQLDPARIARGLSIAEQQIVEIAKALSLEARVIVMDEPTAALSAVEVDRLFGVAEKLRSDGAAVLFISHRLEEVFSLCQRVTVLRDGRHVMSRELAGLTPDDLVRAMVGRELVEHVPEEQNIGENVLSVERLTREGVFVDVSFDVRAGEIVALAGLVGAGRSEVARAIFGIDRFDAGSVTLNGQAVAPRLTGRRDGRRDRVRPGGPSPARARHGDVDQPQHHARIASAPASRRADPQSRGAGLRARLGDPPPGQVRPHLESDDVALGREPAEGRARRSGSRAGRSS